MMKKLAILGFPRSATKLLADVYVQQGYHSFGEFFNPNNIKIVDADVPYAVRISRAEQINLAALRKLRTIHYHQYTQCITISNRLDKFKSFKDLTPSIVTVWLENYIRDPELYNVLSDRFYLCTQRKDKFEQLLSRAITSENYNHDEESVSKPVTVDLKDFEYGVFAMTRIEKIQANLVKQGQGMYIDFDELTSGTADLGFDYVVSSNDQHRDVTSLITNLDEVQDLYTKLKTYYK